jgi:hypothetical protein
MTEPMREPSVPSEQVRGPQDLVVRMNEATSEDYAMVPYPARQQLGDHSEPYDAGSSEHPELHEFLGQEGGEAMLHSLELSEPNLDLSRSVTYHLEATEPPAEPAGAPGTSGYNKLNRHVAPAPGFEHPADYSLEQGAGVRTFRLPEGEGLPAEQQADVDGVGPFPPAPVLMSGDLNRGSDDTRERSNQTPDVNDPYRQPDGSLRDPKEVQQAAPAHPEGDFGSKEVAMTEEAPKEEAEVDVTGARVENGPDVADGPDQTVPAVGQDDTENKSEEQQKAEAPAKRRPGRPRKDGS